MTAVPAAAQDEDEQRQLAWVLERGRLLFDLDRAAWVATDDMLARVADPQHFGMRGYIVEPAAGGYRVIFYGGPEEAPVAVYRAQVEGHRVIAAELLPPGDRPDLTAAQRRLIDARAAVKARQWSSCGRATLNVAVIPPDAPDAAIDVYIMTPQMEDQVYPLGGHNRATVAPDGTVLSTRKFMNSCLALSPLADSAVAFVVTHLLDPVPTEIHVFAAIASGMPIYVSTPPDGRIWLVTGDDIEPVADESEGAPTLS